MKKGGIVLDTAHWLPVANKAALEALEPGQTITAIGIINAATFFPPDFPQPDPVTSPPVIRSLTLIHCQLAPNPSK